MSIKVQVQYRNPNSSFNRDSYSTHSLLRLPNGDLVWHCGGGEYISERPLDQPILPADDRDFIRHTIPFREGDLEYSFNA